MMEEMKKQAEELIEQAYKRGFDEGYERGVCAGYNTGAADGYKKGIKKGIKECRKCTDTASEAIEKLNKFAEVVKK